MKKIVSLLAATAVVALAIPAAAQVTGEVKVTGSVQGRCSVVEQGGNDESSFEGTIALGALDDADGTLKDDLSGSTAADPAGSEVTTRVVCTAASVDIAITADTLVTGARGATNDTGYTNEIDYVAELEVNTASGGLKSVSYDTSDPQVADSQATVGRVAAGQGDNVTVRAYGFVADTGSGETLLEAGEYASTITVTIEPSA